MILQMNWTNKWPSWITCASSCRWLCHLCYKVILSKTLKSTSKETLFYLHTFYFKKIAEMFVCESFWQFHLIHLITSRFFGQKCLFGEKRGWLFLHLNSFFGLLNDGVVIFEKPWFRGPRIFCADVHCRRDTKIWNGYANQDLCLGDVSGYLNCLIWNPV